MTDRPKPRPRIYLAGPEVFLPDAKGVGSAKARLCAEAGFEGCFPLDAPLALDGLKPVDQARVISAACETMMQSCDLAIANCTPFRGVSMDAGTAYEIGFMRALGRPVFGYTNAKGTYAARASIYRQHGILAADCDRLDVEIENFDLAENLMIAIAAADIVGPQSMPTPTRRDLGNDQINMADLAGFRACLALAAQSQLRA
jgi:nucleoside 2-deoxyribosyltransferase